MIPAWRPTSARSSWPAGIRTPETDGCVGHRRAHVPEVRRVWIRPHGGRGVNDDGSPPRRLPSSRPGAEIARRHGGPGHGSRGVTAGDHRTGHRRSNSPRWKRRVVRHTASLFIGHPWEGSLFRPSGGISAFPTSLHIEERFGHRGMVPKLVLDRMRDPLAGVCHVGQIRPLRDCHSGGPSRGG
jgi:hypothetical protein